MVILLKKILLIFVLFLSSCSKVEMVLENAKLYPCYAVNVEGNYELIYVDYVILDEVDIFELFTIKQNNLPINFYSYGNGNITLERSVIINDCVYYYVDRFVFLSDVEMFKKQLELNVKLYNYSDVFLILNNEEL